MLDQIIYHPQMNFISAQFRQTITEVWKEEGTEWLARLPAVLVECARRWSLVVEPPFANLSYNYVAPATTRDGREVVLKLGVPRDELLTEIEALRLYGGRGMVQLLDANEEQGILLLERLRPGNELVELGDDEQETKIAAGVMKQFWRPLPEKHPFPSVHDWAKGMERLRVEFNGGTGPFPARLVETAEALFAELLGSMDEPVLLHGDLHHYNILAAEREKWLAIDPKGIVGEPAYEIGAWLRNPTPQVFFWPDMQQVTARRVDQSAEILGVDRQRIRGWGIAQAVLSAWWDYEDHGRGWEQVLACAEWLLTPNKLNLGL
jgi:streptomycin 6-kinase